MEQFGTAFTTGTLRSRALRMRAGATARTYTQRAFTHFFEGEYDRAEIAYRAALCLNPVDADVTGDLESLGRALSRSRE
jgi:tetratricopeptide (TPR) repeat protein